MSGSVGSPQPLQKWTDASGVVMEQKISGSAATPSASGESNPRTKPEAPRTKPDAPTDAGPNGEVGKLTHLVIDSGAIIKGAGINLASTSENFWTVPEVVAEIRDKNSRRNLGMLPFELKLKEPSDEAMKFVMGFAKQTGDLQPLSLVDLKVLALTYMLERQETGGAHLRTTPMKPGTSVRTDNKTISRSTLAADERSSKMPNGPSASAIRGTEAMTAHGDTTDDVAAIVANGSGSKSAEESNGEEPGDGGGIQNLCEQLERTTTAKLVDGQERKETPTVRAVGHPAVGGTANGTANGVQHPDKQEKECASMSPTVGPVAKGNGDGDGEDGNAREKDIQVDGEVEEGGDGGLEHGGVVDDDGDDEDEEGSDEDEEGSDEDGDDDDDFEPPCGDFEAAGGDVRHAVAEGIAEEENGSLDDEDFPSLGGGSVAPVHAESSSGTAHPGVSWSVMARSNPAPFKNSVKPEPASIPAKLVDVTKSAASLPEPPTRTTAASRPDRAEAGASRILGASAAFGMSGGRADEDDGEGWINPSNIKLHKMLGMGIHGPPQTQKKLPGVEKSECRAGCATTDFAMQNVLLQVGLPLLSLDGMTVKRVQQWILRCSACFKTCKELSRLFCPICGSAAMSRVACSVDARTGEIRLHMRRKKKVNLRGSKYSIPAPNPTKGRFEGDLLLREDQLLTGIWAQKAKRKQKNVASMFGEDITSNVGLTVSKSADIVVGYGRKNPNAARGRERRGKKSSKKRP